MKSSDLMQSFKRRGANNYHPLPIVLSRGEGATVWDVEGKSYLDFLSCYSALNFGHQHPKIIQALRTQLEKLAICSRAFHSEALCLFAEKITAVCGFDKVLAMNTGTEAVETAIKLARKWGYLKKMVPSDQANIIVMENNFHGRTVTVVSFSSEPLYRKDFGPFTPGFSSVPFGDISRLEASITDHTVAVLLEPIQAEAGILLPPTGYLKKVRELCQKKNVLMILDEIQTGMARTGSNFCYELHDAKPDVLILGKSLGGGVLALSAVLASTDVMDVIEPGEHGSTFGGNPLASAVGVEALSVMVADKMAEKASQIGKVSMQALRAKPLPGVREIRGSGALIGIELEPQLGGARRYCERLAANGVLCKETHEHVIRIAPPLMISTQELERGLDQILEVLNS